MRIPMYEDVGIIDIVVQVTRGGGQSMLLRYNRAHILRYQAVLPAMVAGAEETTRAAELMIRA